MNSQGFCSSKAPCRALEGLQGARVVSTGCSGKMQMYLGLGLGRYWGDKKITKRLPLAGWFFLRAGGGCKGSLGDLG